MTGHTRGVARLPETGGALGAPEGRGVPIMSSSRWSEFHARSEVRRPPRWWRRRDYYVPTRDGTAEQGGERRRLRVARAGPMLALDTP